MIFQDYSIIVDLPNFATTFDGDNLPDPNQPVQSDETPTTEESSITITESDMQSITNVVQEKAAAVPGVMFYIGIYALLFAGLYFLFIRPNKKKQKAMREMQMALKVGDDVVTSAGLYGVISSIGEDCFVVEFGTNKGIRIPVRKLDVIGVNPPNIQPSKEVKETREVKETKPVKENKWLKNPMSAKPTNNETMDNSMVAVENNPSEIMDASSQIVETTELNVPDTTGTIVSEPEIKEKIDN